MFSKYPLCPWTSEGAEDIHFRRLSIYLQCTYLGWLFKVFWAKDHHQGQDGKTLDEIFQFQTSAGIWYSETEVLMVSGSKIAKITEGLCSLWQSAHLDPPKPPPALQLRSCELLWAWKAPCVHSVALWTALPAVTTSPSCRGTQRTLNADT